MKRIILVGVGALALTAGVLAQTPAGNFDAALAAAPANMRDGAMVIKWKPTAPTTRCVPAPTA